MTSLLVLSLLLASPSDELIAGRARGLYKEALQYGASPRAAASLIRLQGLGDEVDDLNLLAEPFANLLYRRSHPDARLLARLFYADVERARGRTTKAAELLEPLGFVQDFYVVGGFDNEGKSGCDTDFGPESSLSLSAAYPGKGREVSWRKLPAKTLDGYVDLSTMVRPSSQVVAYALTFLQADIDTKVNLGLGTSGAFRLFVNGVKVAASDRYNLPRVDQSRVQVRLRKGINRVLVKVCQSGGPLGLYLRQERAEGAPRSATVVLPDAVPPLEKGTAPMPVAMPTMAETFERAVKAAPLDAALKADWATVLAWSHAYDEKERTPSRLSAQAADAKPTDASLQLIAASLADDPNDRRRFLSKALEAEPKSPWARLGLAQHELAQEHPEAALPLLDGLLAESPRFAPAVLSKVRALDALQMHPAATALAESMFSQLQHVPGMAKEAASQARRLDRLDETEGRLRTVLALRYDDTGTRRVLASLLSDLGKLEPAVEQLQRVLQLDPYDNASRLRLGELLSANGQLERGLTFFAEAKTFAPDEPDVFEREGRALLFAGKKDDAVAAFGKSLALRPQNPALKEVVRTLTQANGAQAASIGPEYVLPLQPLIEEAKRVKDEDAVYLADVTAVRVQGNGLSSRFHQLAVKVLTDRGVEAFRQLPISYSPDRQEVRVLKARVTKSDGSIVDSYQDSDQHMNEPWTGMYYDARARVLSFPQLGQGDVLELQWRIDDTAIENLLSDYFGDIDSVQSTSTKLRYRYVVEMPKERALYWNKGSLPAWVTASQKPLEGRVAWLFEASNVARVVPENAMPGWSEVSTVLHVSTYQNWEQVGRYWWGLVKDQLTPTDEVVRQVDAVLKGVDRKDQRAVVQAIYDFVVTNTRYVALEFGIHGYKPYRVDRVLARRFGDCKDKASLIVAMLKIAGVDARLVLLRMRSLGNISSEPASLSAFNHAIAYVPSLQLWLDGTAEFHGTSDTPSADRVADVLLVEPAGGSRFLVTPEAKPEENLTAMELEVALKKDGSADVKGHSTVKGQQAPELRRAYQSASSRKATFEQGWAQSFPGLSVKTLDVSDTTKLEQPMSVSFSMSAPRYAEVLPGGLRFYPLGAGRAYTQVLAPLAERKHDAAFSGVWQNRFSVKYQLPPGFVARDLPPAFDSSSPFGRAKLSAEVVDGVLQVKGEVELSQARVKASDYAAFRQWLLEVDQAFSRRVTVLAVGGQTAMR